MSPKFRKFQKALRELGIDLQLPWNNDRPHATIYCKFVFNERDIESGNYQGVIKTLDDGKACFVQYIDTIIAGVKSELL